ncbi:hypothetical protein T484DRAFT_3599214 [Baffinella frigidus]|nr:hypothetical protein T484DRAFT_3599214 [Cryptophyta sp. CCMP2293]
MEHARPKRRPRHLLHVHPTGPPYTLPDHPTPYRTTLHPIGPPYTLSDHPTPCRTNLHPHPIGPPYTLQDHPTPLLPIGPPHPLHPTGPLVSATHNKLPTDNQATTTVHG